MRNLAVGAVVALVTVFVACGGGGVDTSAQGGAAATGPHPTGSGGAGGGTGGNAGGKAASSSNASASSSTGVGGGCQGCGASQNECCDGTCVDNTNDPFHCGDCQTVCPGPHPFCGGGKCGMAICAQGTTCSGQGQSCCESECCNAGEMCCVVASGESTAVGCAAPVNGTCPPHVPSI